MSGPTAANGARVPSGREVLALAVPALGALAVEPLMGLVDTALLGRVGETELAALGAANAMLGLIATSLIFLEYGTTARLARHFGASQHGLLARDAVQTLWLATFLGLPLTALLLFLPGPMLRLVNVPAEVLPAGTTYLSIRAFGALAGLWIRAANGVFRGLQDTRTPLAILAGSTLLNAVLDVVLIFGWPALGLPAFGIAGAAWATVIATWLAAVAFLWLLRRRLQPDGAEPVGLAPRADVLAELMRLTRDLLIRSIALQLVFFTTTRMVASIGTTALAAHQVAWQMWYFLAFMLDSLAIAGQALIGRTLGAGRPDHARLVGRRLCLWGLVLGVVFALGFVLLRDELPRLFTPEAGVLQAVASIIWIVALMQVPNAVLFVLDGLLIGALDMSFLRNALAALGLFGMLCAWLGATLGQSLAGVWLGFTVFMLVRLAVMGARWWSGAWAREPSPS